MVVGGGGMRGPVQIACLGVEPNERLTQLVATGVEERSPQPTVHLTIIQACFTLSSRVLLVSNLRRSNWKCTVKRFFKSTVTIAYIMRWESLHITRGIYWSMKQVLDANWCSAPWCVYSKFPWFLWHPGQVSVCCPSVPTSFPNTSSLHWRWGITLPLRGFTTDKYPHTTLRASSFQALSVLFFG